MEYIIKNAVIATMDKENPMAEAAVVKDGKFIFCGSTAEAEKALSEMGFEKQGDAWQKSGEICVLKVTASAEATAAGTLLRQQVSAVADGETYFTLPVARYQEVQP